jgi:hypothetical protein
MKTLQKYTLSIFMMLSAMQICAMEYNEQQLAPELELVPFMLDMNIVEESEQKAEEQTFVEKYYQEQARRKGNEKLTSLLSNNVDCANNVMKFLCGYAGDARPSLVLYGSDRQIVPWIIAKQRCAIVQAVRENKYKKFKKSCELLDIYTLLFISPDAPGSADFIKNYKCFLHRNKWNCFDFSDVIWNMTLLHETKLFISPDAPVSADFIKNCKCFLYHNQCERFDFSGVIWNRTLLHETNGSEFIAYLLQCGIHVNSQDSTGWSRLHISAQLHQPEIAQLLLDHGADPNIQDRYGCSPLCIAADMGRIEVAKILLDHGANPHISARKIYYERIARMRRAYEASCCSIM